MVDATGGYAKAIAAYRNAERSAGVAGAAQSPAAGASFADMVSHALAEGIGAGKATEQAATSAVATGTGIGSVVTAVAEAETALQAVVAIRDRVIESYKDVMRMSI